MGERLFHLLIPLSTLAFFGLYLFTDVAICQHQPRSRPRKMLAALACLAPAIALLLESSLGPIYYMGGRPFHWGGIAMITAIWMNIAVGVWERRYRTSANHAGGQPTATSGAEEGKSA